MNKTKFLALISVLAFTLVSGVSHAAGRVFFKNIKDGDTLTQDQKIEFGVEGIKLRPAAEDVNDKKSGHHHLLIDSVPVKEGEVVPATERSIHYGKAQTETTVGAAKITPGKHRLTLQFADGAHRSYGPSLSATVQVTIK